MYFTSIYINNNEILMTEVHRVPVCRFGEVASRNPDFLMQISPSLDLSMQSSKLPVKCHLYRRRFKEGAYM